jgi:hypothetical protein
MSVALYVVGIFIQLISPAGVVVADVNSVAVRLSAGSSLGQAFYSPWPVVAVAVWLPTWYTTDSGATLELRRGVGTNGPLVDAALLRDVSDNSWARLELRSPVGKGRYTVVLTKANGTIGWWAEMGGGENAYALSSFEGASTHNDLTFDMQFYTPGVWSLMGTTP